MQLDRQTSLGSLVDVAATTQPRPNDGAGAPHPLTPRPLLLDGFLSSVECSHILRELQFTLWRPSMAYQMQVDGSYRNELNRTFRVSETALEEWFTDELTTTIKEVEQRLQRMFEFDLSHLEAWQATSYARDGFVDYHVDAGYWDGHPDGDRILTFLIYLTTPRKGGNTHFRALDVEVTGKAGRLVVWNNLFPDGRSDHRMIHAGTPLLEGDKTTLVTWLRQNECRDKMESRQRRDRERLGRLSGDVV